jgi:transcriptional regulator with XRE-family HTH domain
MAMQALPTFRQNLRLAMKLRGLSQRDVAAKAKTAHPAVNRILQGKQQPTLDLADRLADAVGMSLHELLRKS